MLENVFVAFNYNSSYRLKFKKSVFEQLLSMFIPKFYIFKKLRAEQSVLSAVLDVPTSSVANISNIAY